MPQFDLPLTELFAYQPELTRPADLERFWSETIAASRRRRTPTSRVPVDTGLRLVHTWDVEFSGFDGQPVRGWLHLPAIPPPPGGFTVVIEYLGAGAGRGLPHESSLWAAAGHAHFLMDNRGQGSGWRIGDTADPVDERSGAPAHPGFTTRGILHPDSYYYRRLYIDAVLAIDTVREFPEIDAARVILEGISQGGGVAIAAASLAPDVRGLMAEVPFLSDFRRGVAIAGTPPYSEVAAYLAVHRDEVDRVFQTLAYFDVALLAERATAPALFVAALMDVTTPPSTVFAAFNNYGGEKEMIVYPFNGHEGGGSHYSRRRLAFVSAIENGLEDIAGR